MIKITTYVLDDDMEDLELMKHYLERIFPDCDFQMYCDYKLFLQAIEQGCHICIIDHHLNSVVDGIEVGRLVLHKNQLCTLILFSGSRSYEVVKEATNSGFRYIIDKNEVNAYEEVAQVVKQQIPLIEMRIGIFNKYFAQLNQYENAV